MRRRLLLPALSLSTVVLSTVVAGCAPLLAANPRYVTDSGARPQGAATTSKAPDGPPPIAVPKKDMTWHECTSRVFGDATVPAVLNSHFFDGLSARLDSLHRHDLPGDGLDQVHVYGCAHLSHLM